jgi:hypothetical protein
MTTRRISETTLPRHVIRESTVLLDTVVERLAADGVDRLAMADYFVVYGTRLSAQYRGVVPTSERLRDFADITEAPALHAPTGPVGHA